MLTPPAPEGMTYSSDNERLIEEELGALGKFFVWLCGFLFWSVIMIHVKDLLLSRRPGLEKSITKWFWIGIASYFVFMFFFIFVLPNL